MYEELIRRLKESDFERPDCTPFECGAFSLLAEAGTALAALQAENAELRTQHRVERCEAAGYDCEGLGMLRATLSRVEAERDAAVKFIKWIDGEFGNYMPVLYHHRFEEWCGAQGEG